MTQNVKLRFSPRKRREVGDGLGLKRVVTRVEVKSVPAVTEVAAVGMMTNPPRRRKVDPTFLPSQNFLPTVNSRIIQIFNPSDQDSGVSIQDGDDLTRA